jgi:DNA-binding transcriptional regulator YiaG
MSDLQPKAKRRNQVKYSWNPDMIRALREHMNLTQRELADQLEVRQQTISEWETGLHTPHRSTQKTLSMVAERAGFEYNEQLSAEQPHGDGAAGSHISDPPIVAESSS